MKITKQGFTKIERDGETHPVAFVVAGNLVHATVWIDGQWRSTTPTQHNDSGADWLARDLARSIVRSLP